MATYRPTCITHDDRRSTPPFQCLLSLPDQQAVDPMRLFTEDSPFGARIMDPAGYLKHRRKSEALVRSAFIQKGSSPQLDYPIFFVLAGSHWLVENAPGRSLHQEIRIELVACEEGDLSFTYPNSMISFWLGRGPTSLFCLPEFHGKVFTRPEIPGTGEPNGPPDGPPGTGLGAKSAA